MHSVDDTLFPVNTKTSDPSDNQLVDGELDH